MHSLTLDRWQVYSHPNGLIDFPILGGNGSLFIGTGGTGVSSSNSLKGRVACSRLRRVAYVSIRRVLENGATDNFNTPIFVRFISLVIAAP